MKRTLYLAIILLGISVIIGGCAGSGNNHSFTVVAEVNEESEFPFVGCWKADDGSLLYIDDEIEHIGSTYDADAAGDIRPLTEYGGHLYYEFSGEKGHYDKCFIFYAYFQIDDNNWTLLTADEDGSDKELFVFNTRFQTVHSRSNGITFHKDPSTVNNIAQKLNKGEFIRQQEKGTAQIPVEYSWLFGGWSSGEDSFLLKEPNMFNSFPSRSNFESEGWRKFRVNGETMFVDIPHIKGEFILVPSEKLIISEEGVKYKKVFGTDVPFPIKGAWRANNGDLIYISDDIIYEGVTHWSSLDSWNDIRTCESFSVYQYYEMNGENGGTIQVPDWVTDPYRSVSIGKEWYEETDIEYADNTWKINVCNPIYWLPDSYIYNKIEDVLVSKTTNLVFRRESVNEKQIKNKIAQCIKRQEKAEAEERESSPEGNTNSSNSSSQEDYSWIVGSWYVTTPYGTMSIKFDGNGQKGRVTELSDAMNINTAKYGTYEVIDNILSYRLNGERGIVTEIYIESGHKLSAGGGYYYKKLD